MGYVVHGVAKESEMTSQLNGNTNKKKKKIDSTDIENKRMVTKGEREYKLGIWRLIYTCYYI